MYDDEYKLLAFCRDKVKGEEARGEGSVCLPPYLRLFSFSARPNVVECCAASEGGLDPCFERRTAG